MGLSRRFLNLIVGKRNRGVQSLRCIDLKREQFFYPGTPPSNNRSAEEATLKMKRLSLPSATLNFRASADEDDQWRIDCFPLANRKMVFMDQSGRSFLFDADTRRVATMPSLHAPKRTPISLFVHDADADETYAVHRWGSRLFVMERNPQHEHDKPSDQFEAFVFRKRIDPMGLKAWHGHVLPPPPFVRGKRGWNDEHRRRRHQITAYAVVGGGSHICVSAEGAGTYIMDTTSFAWTHLGNWMLPFHGKVEYVPELKLWFGLSAEQQAFAAADLSTLKSQPQLVGDWMDELDDRPEEWRKSRDSQVISLGSGRFCIARFFQIVKPHGWHDERIEQDFVVLSGVEVVTRRVDGDEHAAGDGDAAANGGCSGETKLRMVKHRSKRLDSDNGRTIQAIF